MMKNLVTATTAALVTASALTVPAAEAAEPTPTTTTATTTAAPAKAQTKPQDDEFSTLKIVGAVVGSLAFVAAAAGGACWAMQQGFIPNPAPQLIPCNPAPKPAPAPAPAPAPRPAPAPAPAPAPRPAPAPAPRPAPAPAPRPAPAPAPAAKTYPNCRAVWNDLGGPIRRGDAGYGSHLDRDGDGVGCEKRPK